MKNKLLTSLIITPSFVIPQLITVTSCNSTVKYTITFVSGEGGTIKETQPLTVSAGTQWKDVTKPKTYPNDGMMFDNWYNNDTKISSNFVVNSDLTITAKFGIKRTISLSATTGGSITGSTSIDVLDGSTWANVKSQAKQKANTGYEFDNWYWNDHIMTDTDVITADINIVAKFNICIYTITFIATEGGTISGTTTKQVPYGTLWKNITDKPETTPNINYDFVDWYYNGSPINDDFKIVNSITIKATFKKIELTNSVNPTIYYYTGSGFEKFVDISEHLSNQNFIVRHFDNLPMGYVSLEAYLGTRWSSFFKVETSDRKTTITNKVVPHSVYFKEGDNTCVIDHDKQTITFQDYEVFSDYSSSSYGPMTGGTGGGENYYKDVTINEYNKNSPLVINLSDYGMRTYCYAVDNETVNGFIPYEVFTNIFGLYIGYGSSYYGIYCYYVDYNGKGFVQMHEGYKKDYGYVDYKKTAKSFAKENFYNSEYMEYCYNLLALTLDVKYGLTERVSRADGSTIRYLNGGAYNVLNKYHNQLVSLNDDVSSDALRTVFFQELDDGGHTGYWDLNALATKQPTISTATVGKEYLHTVQVNSLLTTARTENTNNVSPEHYWINEKGKTQEWVDDNAVDSYYKEYTASGKDTIAYITFDGFNGEYEDNYSESEKTAGRELQSETNENNYWQDTLRLTMYANKQIKANNIKNVVIDLSCNGGGYVYTEFFIASWICGGVNQKIYNPKTNSYCDFTVKADVDGDGDFDQDDYLSSDVKLYVITSSNSFSCGNMLPCNIQDNRPNNTTFIGTKSGGGACYVGGNLFGGADCQYQISSTNHMLKLASTKTNFVTVDTGCVITNGWEISDTSAPANYYDRDAINSKIWA